MPEYVQGVELTQDGMRAIFERMGQDIASGIIYNGNPDIRLDMLNQQGFMPILTGVSPTQESGHWIMLIKGQGNQYYLFDPLGEGSGRSYQSILARKLPQHATLSVIPNGTGFNRGLCGYWVASAGVRARAALIGGNPPTLEELGNTITQDMQNELNGTGYREITGWLRAVAHEFPAGVVQTDATALRRATEKDLPIAPIQPIATTKGTILPELTTEPTATKSKPLPDLGGFSLYSDPNVRQAIEFANKNYLSKPYEIGRMEAEPTEMGGITVNRSNHGLAHTLRTMAYAEVIVAEARKAVQRGETLKTFPDGRTLADITANDLQKIMIAQAFFVAGRLGEESDAKNYYHYHKLSREAFEAFIDANKSTLIPLVFKNEADVKHYADIVEDLPTVDGEKMWGATPEHMLVNQCHMVDLTRCKEPPEPALESFYKALADKMGQKGAEAVFSIQRKFFKATGETIKGNNPQSKDEYEIPNTTHRYLMENGNPVKYPKGHKQEGQLQRVDKSSYALKVGQSFMTVEEYYQIPTVRSSYPGHSTVLENPYEQYKELKLIDAQRLIMADSRNRGLCETRVDHCLAKLKEAQEQSILSPVKEALQSSSTKDRRPANVDEIAAARIIQQIMANPKSIQKDHVLLNGQRLEEQFFRDLLAKCDMDIVGSLLTDNEFNNIDRLMQQERNTAFHSTDPEASPVNLGEAWEDDIRNRHSQDKNQIKYDLIYLMQSDPWYFSRVNAIAQNRDKGSSFKEVLITTLMTPLTRKAMVDTHGKSQSPQTLYRGLVVDDTFKNKLLNQANTIIANTTEHLFTDPSAQTFMQLKLNDLSKISSKTNASNSTDIGVPRDTWSSNLIFEIQDPDGILQAKKVGTHGRGAENEFSFYLPEDVVLVPTKVTLDGQTINWIDKKPVNVDRHIITFVAVKSPDFFPRHESGFAVEPFLRMQMAELAEVKNAVEREQGADVVQDIINFQESIGVVVNFSQLPNPYKNFLRDTIDPVLQQSLQALISGEASELSNALKAIPDERQWAGFNFEEARQAKNQMSELKQLIAQKLVLEKQVLPALTQCQEALTKDNIAAGLLALKDIPSDKEMSQIPTISKKLREQIQQVKQTLTESLGSIQNAANTQIVTDPTKVEKRFVSLIDNLSQRITILENAKHPDTSSIKKAIANLNILQEEIKLLRNEKIRMHVGTDKIDFQADEKLEGQLNLLNEALYNTYAAEIKKQIVALETEKSKKIPDLSKMISNFYEQTSEVEQLHQLKIKRHGDSKDPLDISDINDLKAGLQQINQYLVGTVLNKTRVLISQMDATSFHEQEKEIQQNLKYIDLLAKTLDDSTEGQKQKGEIQKLNESFTEKQTTYPTMMQVHFKSEALIIQLRELSEAQLSNLAKQRSNKTQEITRNRWMYQGVTDFFGLTTDERVKISDKGKKYDQFKKDLNNDTSDVQQLIHKLLEHKATQFEKLFGIPKEEAENLHTLLSDLGKNNMSMKQMESCLQRMDEVLSELSKKTMLTDPTKREQELPQQNVQKL